MIKYSKDKSKTEFSDRFKPSYTPLQMLKLGVFGGAYFSDPSHKIGTPTVVFALDKSLWGNSKPDKTINKYGVLAGASLDFWKEKNLMHKDDPAGWFQWYIKYYYGRRHEDDKRQINRWRSFVARHGAQAYGKTGRERQKQALLQWAWDNNTDPKSIK